MHALTLETIGLSKRFGDFVALDEVSLSVRAGSVHALLGENGAGKSTLVKAIVGFQRGDGGSVLIDNREQDIQNPGRARALGIGMVYQHFTLVPGMTVAENLLLARGNIPSIISWRQTRAELDAFMQSAPFKLALDVTPNQLSVGEKQKLEILKQLFLRPRLLILDEPTSVLTPQEADEVLGALRAQAHRGECTILMITHKFREVMAFADDVSVLRRGRLITASAVERTSPSALAEAMVGDQPNLSKMSKLPQAAQRGAAALAIEGLRVLGDRGDWALDGCDLQLAAGEILGLAGVSGNGQRELLQAITGQRRKVAGRILVNGFDFHGYREENRRLAVRCLPEEPLLNACVPELSVAANMALRDFDQAPQALWGTLRWRVLADRAQKWVKEYGIKVPNPQSPICQLSGGNVQRTVLARELADAPRLLLVANPTFGLDFAATAEIHSRLVAARNRGAGVLLISEDLDEILQLADRVAVISAGRVVYSCRREETQRSVLGQYMAGEPADRQLQEAA
jgi:ABC-type uncharacterized transport system ATPase subunit